jgi:hypothetical protein
MSAYLMPMKLYEIPIETGLTIGTILSQKTCTENELLYDFHEFHEHEHL